MTLSFKNKVSKPIGKEKNVLFGNELTPYGQGMLYKFKPDPMMNFYPIYNPSKEERKYVDSENNAYFQNRDSSKIKL